MRSAFRKISRVGSLAGGTKWYLSDDCLLAAKRVMYVAEYRRFYLRDLEYVMVWPSPAWRWRLIVPALLLGILGISLWVWVAPTAGEIFSGIALAWVLLELALGPTAKSRICTTGTSVELPLVKRMRQAKTALASIDAAVRAARGALEQAVAPATLSTVDPRFQPSSEVSATSTVTAATQTNGS